MTTHKLLLTAALWLGILPGALPLLWAGNVVECHSARRHYEHSNHLGNVLQTTSDKKQLTSPAPGVESNVASVSTYTDYAPFGAPLPNRNGADVSYRFGFQEQERDDELKGPGNSVNYKYRMHDPRIGRFFAVDPLADKYPYNSTYAFSENKVIDAVELEGLEQVDADFKDVSDGTTAGSMSTSGSMNTSTGGYVAKKSTYGNPTGTYISLYGALSTQTLITKNGTGAEPNTSFGVGQVGFTTNTDFGGSKFNFGISFSQTLNTYSTSSRFNEFSNYVGAITFTGGTDKFGSLGLTWGNDNDLLTLNRYETDRGLTNYFRLEYTHPKGRVSVGVESIMYTPQRHGGPNGDGTGDFLEGGFDYSPGGNLYDNGLYDVNTFAGNFAHYALITGTYRGPKLRISISAGINDSSSGEAIQGTAHGKYRDPPVPEFPWPSFQNFAAGVSVRRIF